jgi:hypothetical protein
MAKTSRSLRNHRIRHSLRSQRNLCIRRRNRTPRRRSLCTRHRRSRLNSRRIRLCLRSRDCLACDTEVTFQCFGAKATR